MPPAYCNFAPPGYYPECNNAPPAPPPAQALTPIEIQSIIGSVYQSDPTLSMQITQAPTAQVAEQLVAQATAKSGSPYIPPAPIAAPLLTPLEQATFFDPNYKNDPSVKNAISIATADQATQLATKAIADYKPIEAAKIAACKANPNLPGCQNNSGLLGFFSFVGAMIVGVLTLGTGTAVVAAATAGSEAEAADAAISLGVDASLPGAIAPAAVSAAAPAASLGVSTSLTGGANVGFLDDIIGSPFSDTSISNIYDSVQGASPGDLVGSIQDALGDVTPGQIAGAVGSLASSPAPRPVVAPVRPATVAAAGGISLAAILGGLYLLSR